MTKEEKDTILYQLELTTMTEFTKLEDIVLKSAVNSPTPFMLNLQHEELITIYDDFYQAASCLIDKLNLARSLLDDPIAMSEKIFEKRKEWCTAETCNLIHHDYICHNHFNKMKYMLPILRFKCSYTAKKRGDLEKHYFYLKETIKVLEWHQKSTVEWLEYEIYKNIGNYHFERNELNEAIEAYQKAINESNDVRNSIFALRRLCSIYKKLNRPDREYIMAVKAYELAKEYDLRDDIRIICGLKLGFLKMELGFRPEDISFVKEIIDSITDPKYEIKHQDPESIQSLLGILLDSFKKWSEEGKKPDRQKNEILKKKYIEWLEIDSGDIDKDKVIVLVSLLPILGELKEYDLFNQYLEMGLSISKEFDLKKERSLFERVKLRLKAQTEKTDRCLNEFRAVDAKIDPQMVDEEQLIFYAENIEAFIKKPGDISAKDNIIPLLNKIRNKYLLIRDNIPTMDGRLFFRSKHQRTLEICITACFHLFKSIPSEAETWVSIMWEFIDLAKGRSLDDYLTGNLTFFKNVLSDSELKEYHEKKKLFNESLEQKEENSFPLKNLRDYELQLYIKYFSRPSLQHQKIHFDIIHRQRGKWKEAIVLNYFFFKDYYYEEFGIVLMLFDKYSWISVIPAEESIKKDLSEWDGLRYRLSPWGEKLFTMLIKQPLQEFGKQVYGFKQFAAFPYFPKIKKYDMKKIDTDNSGGYVKTLVIIPDGMLEDIPFEALPIDNKSGLCLIDKFKTVYSHSLANFKASQPIASNFHWYGFGNPGDCVDKKSNPREPCFEKEIETIKTILSETHRVEEFLGVNASKENFLEIVNNSNMPVILHLALHGSGDRNVPEKSSILFPIYDKIGEKIPERVTFREILELDLSNIELVVLSACETTVGKTYSGEGNLALSWAFKAAGAQRVIATRWKINDPLTFQIMEIFYKELNNTGSVEEALQTARRIFIKNNPSVSPLGWGAFLYYV